MQAEFVEQLEQAKQQQAEALRAAAEREQQLRTERDAAFATTAALKDELAGTREALSRLQERHHAQSVVLATAQADNAGLQQRLADRAAGGYGARPLVVAVARLVRALPGSDCRPARRGTPRL